MPQPEIEKFLPPREMWPLFTFNIPYAQPPAKINITRDLLERPAKSREDSTAILFNDRRITWRQLIEEINRVGCGLRSLGIRAADRICLFTSNCPEYVASFFAALKIGAIVVPIMFLYGPREIVHAANHSEAKAFIVSADLLPTIEKIKGELKTVEHIIVIDKGWEGLQGLIKQGYLLYTELISKSYPSLEAVDLRWDDVYAILYTSGTTGMPKGCVRLVGSFYAGALAHVSALPGGPGDVYMTTAPLQFSYGLDVLMAWCGSKGAALAILPPGPLKPEQIAVFICRYGVTHFYSIPRVYDEILQIHDVEKRYNLGIARYCISAAYPLSRDTFERWKAKFGVKIRTLFGTTETQACLYCWREDDAPCSLGSPEPGFNVVVIDDDGRLCGPGKEGQLAIQGHGGALYWKDFDKQKEAVFNGWTLTGDLVYRDEQGNLWWKGRIKDVLKVSGATVSPFEIEEVIMQHPAVKEVAVVGKPDEVRGEVPVAYIILKEGYTPSDALADEIKKLVRSQLAAYKQVRELKFVEDFPRGPTGKVLRRVLRQMSIKGGDKS
jgi:benzoate-CoA ligase